MNIKEQFPNYKGFYCNGFVTIKKKKYKNGWCKFENKSKKEIEEKVNLSLLRTVSMTHTNMIQVQE